MTLVTQKDLEYSLTPADILKSLPYDVQIIPYNTIVNFDSIDDMLYPNDACVIFYETNRKGRSAIGHWTCIVRSPTSLSILKKNAKKARGEDLTGSVSVVYFNSYGTFVDDEKQYIDPKHQEIIGQLDNTLSRLLYMTGGNMEYNELKLQQCKQGINTCGRHVLCKILSKDLTLEQYQDFMKLDGSTPDEKVVVITKTIMDKTLSPLEASIKLNDMILQPRV
jgi:hypothetical protein